MSTSGTPGRVYGGQYKKSERMGFTELVEHMHALLLLTPATKVVPAGTKFGLHHNGEDLVVLAVLGLRDEFLFSRQMHTCEADALQTAFEEFFEAFNWKNPDDGMDRRFFYSVHLLSEAEQAKRELGPGLHFSPPRA